MPITLTYALMTHNEIAEFAWLMEVLRPIQNENTEIVVLDDFSEPEMVDLIKNNPVRFYQRALNKNFSKQRNYLKSLCRGEFIFLLDPDEIPSPELLNMLPKILDSMRTMQIDGCAVPRLNLLIEDDNPIDARTLNVSDADLLNQEPDYPMRILANHPEMKWINRVHERLLGIKRASRLPEKLCYSLLHCKTYSRQKSQNNFYRSIIFRHIDKLHKSFCKRMGLIKQPVWVEMIL